MADPYSYNPPSLDDELGSDENIKMGLGGLISPASAQSLVMPPPSTPPQTAAAQTTPQTGSLSTAPSQAHPKVSGAPMIPGVATKPENLQNQLSQDQGEYNRLASSGAGVDQVKNRWGRVLGKIADVAGSVLAPGVAQFTPGSTLNHQRLLGQAQARVGADEEQQQKAAALADTQSQANQRNATAAMNTPRPVTAQEAATLGNPKLEGSMMLPKDIGKAQTQGVKNTGALNVVTDKDIASAAAKGQKPVYGDPANPKQVTGFEDDKTSAVYQSRTIQDGLRQAQQAEAQAKAELAAAGNDPTSPAYKLALKKASTASSNAAAANIRAQAYALNANAGNLGVDNQGNRINGSGIIGGRPVGSRFAPQASRAMGNIAKFQDVYSSVDNANAALDEADKSGAKFNSAEMAAALSDPKTTAAQWITGQVNTKLSPQEQNLVITTKALREQINAMRSSVGGGVSDSQINRLVDQLPSATTPDMGYARKQLATVRQQLDRLQSGLIGVNNGPKLQAPGSPANPTNPGGVPNRIPPASRVFAGPIKRGEQAATDPGGHQIVVRGGKWRDPQTGQEVK